MGQPERDAATRAFTELRDTEIRMDLPKEELRLLIQEKQAVLDKAVTALTADELKYMNKEIFY